MTGWGVALLVADAIGVAVAIRLAVRDAAADPSAGSDELRRMRLAEAGTTGALVALVALLASGSGVGTVVGLLSFAVTAGRAVRAAMMTQALMPERSGLAAAYGFLAATCAGAVLILGLLVADAGGGADPDPSTAPPVLVRDSVRFGVPVQHHETPPVTTVSHPPTVADAHYGGGIPVPVERYALDGTTLTLQVAHHTACYSGVVVIGPSGDNDGELAVIVLYGRVFLSPPAPATPSPGTPDPNGCVPPGDERLTDHSAIEIHLPPDLSVTTVRDAGATGPATKVR